MTSPEVVAAIADVESSAAANKAAAYSQLLDKIFASSPGEEALAANLKAYVESILGDSLGIVSSRPLLANFVERFAELRDKPDVVIDVGEHALRLLEPKVVSYEEQDTRLKLAVAGAHEASDDFAASARTLQKISLDSSQRAVTADEKADVWIRIVRCYLEEDDPTSATGYLNRTKNILHDVTNPLSKLMFTLCQARIHDSRRSFLDASTTYHSVSQSRLIGEDEQLLALSAAMTCAVLAPAGPQRARALARLYKDDRAATVDEHPILEKIFLDRLLDPAEVDAFAAKLKPHQLAKTADGSTVLQKAVVEHNLLAVSKLYANIGFDGLGVLLNVDAARAESYAAQMIEQGRLAGHIDQIDRLIVFEGEGSGERKTAHGEGVFGRELMAWDRNVEALAEEVERVSTKIQNQYPEFYAEHMVQ
ncbi:COP9 signalosome-like protein complex subunit 4 [Lineolata rhizophorae]|uniref:COP9 signalosome complex subunit 4 n=1 Tax=Lineolata rhizophorae TaxID=578093 RepID=A0A6A6P7H0_9PEZI|nr:COP9 signalosome-like protein complex subunit 4 [Lineolata rhizophorae]